MSIPIFKKMAEVCPAPKRKIEDYCAVVKIKKGAILENIATFDDRKMAMERLALENYHAQDENDQNYEDKKNGTVYAIVIGVKVRPAS